MPPRGSHAERTQKSRDALVTAATHLFAAQGYAGTSTEAVLAAAGLTRGALYHHFKDKQALFDAVCQRLHAQTAAALVVEAEAEPDPVDGLIAGCLAFVDQMARPEALRILLIEAPSVLGWARWNEIDRAHGFGHLVEGVREAVDAGALQGDPEVIAHLVNGGVNQAVVWAAQSGDPAAMDRVKVGVVQLLNSLRAARD